MSVSPLRTSLSTLLLAVALTTGGAAAEQEAPARLTLERLYSLPRLIGTAPSGFAWSPDSRRVAFLWNDAGFNLRDIWSVDIEDPQLVPRRLTQLRSIEAPESDDPLAAAIARERVEGDRGVSSVFWHPDGRRLVFHLRGAFWVVEEGDVPVRLAATEGAVRAALSPDGTRLAFLREGDLWTVDFEAAMAGDGQPRRRTELASVPQSDGSGAETQVTDFRWSPDGSRLALVESDWTDVPLRGIPDYLAEETELDRVRRAYPGEEPVRRRLGVLDPAEDSLAWLGWPEAPPDLLLSYHWSPDGRRLALDTSDLYAKDRRVFVVDMADGALQPRLLVRDLDPLNETFYFWRIAWTRDATGLYFLSDRDQDYHVYLASVDCIEPAQCEEAPRRLTRGAWAVASLHPVDGGVVVVGNRGRAEERHLFRIADSGGGAKKLSRAKGTHAPVVAPDGRHAAVAFSSDDTPPELLLTALEDPRAERVVTDSPLAEFDRYRWVTPRYVEFTSHVDGSPLHGRLTLPPDWQPDRRYPAILGSVYTDSVRNQWGGRTAHPTWGLDQFLAQEGYVLLNVDMRGSWGRGREHRRGIRLDYGGIDIEDLASGVRYLRTLGFVDMDRVGIWGSSYGGLMTAMSLFRKPGLYAAGVAGAPATNVAHALTGQMAVMMRPEDQPEEYADSSPYLQADGLEDPLMIIHGMRDRVVLFKDSVILTQRLIQLDKDVELVALPDAGHGWDNEGLAQTRFAFRKLFQHFERHLKPGAPPPIR